MASLLGSGLGLVLDLSHAGFAAVLDAAGGRSLASSRRPFGSRHEDAGEWIAECLSEAGGAYPDLRWICVGIGPGSFTGIRIAMAFAQGFALPRGIPLHGFTGFEALFLSAGEKVPAVAVIPASAGRLYLSRALEDPGMLAAASDLAGLAGEGKVLLAPPATAIREEWAAGFSRVMVPREWNAPAIARHARSSGRDARRPCYLQVSAAEEKAAHPGTASG